MQNFTEFLKENYEISEEGFEELSIYEKKIIDSEYDCYIDSIIK